MKKCLAFLMISLGLVQAAAAIPAFARKYGYSCDVCHAPIPHLKAFGEEFMANGYRLPDGEPPRAVIDTGDPTLLLQRNLPLAFRFDAYLGYSPNGKVKSDFQAPLAMKILSGGNISDDISYYTYFLMAEDGKVLGLEDTYLNFRNVFGLPVSIVFGQYRVTDPVKATETRLTAENYAIFKFRVGDSRINLAYDRGVMISTGTAFGLEIIAQVVNGNGIEEQEIFDSDQYKSFIGRLAQTFAGGRVRLGVLGYAGKEVGGGDVVNSVTYLGPDLRLRFANVETLLAYVRRTDSRPLFDTLIAHGDGPPRTINDVASDAFLAEAIFSPWGDKGKTFFTLAWNRVDSALDEADHNALTLNVNRLIRRNLKFTAEYTHDFERDNHRFLAGIVTAF